MKTTRRAFLQISVAAGSAFLVSSKVPNLLAQSGAAEFAPNAYIRIGSDDKIRLWVTRSEMGQGVRTALPMMLADELDVDWTKIIVEQAAAAPRFKGIRLRTSGSGSAVGTWKSLRTAGAAAREMLTNAAAKEWNVNSSECKTANGAVLHSATGRKLTYGQLAQRAAAMPIPTAPVPKSKEQYRYLGRPMKRLDGAAIVTGRAVYGADVKAPGMLQAVMVR